MPSEADTCRTYVIPKLKSAGWEDDFISEQLVLTPGRIVPIGDRHTRKDGLRPDYVSFIRQNIPIAVVEAKAASAHLAKGLQQAMQYAEMLQAKFNALSARCTSRLLQFQTQEELRPLFGRALLPSVLRPQGGAFQGEL